MGIFLFTQSNPASTTLTEESGVTRLTLVIPSYPQLNGHLYKPPMVRRVSSSAPAGYVIAPGALGRDVTLEKADGVLDISAGNRRLCRLWF